MGLLWKACVLLAIEGFSLELLMGGMLAQRHIGVKKIGEEQEALRRKESYRQETFTAGNEN